MAEHSEKHEVRIHIDRTPYESPNPTTGQALYLLGKVPHGHDLYREVEGDKEDDLIRNGDERIRVAQDEHFYSVETHHEKHPHRVRLIVQTLSGNYDHKFRVHDQLQQVVNATFDYLHIVPAEGEVWELRYNDTVLNLHDTIEHAHLPNGAKLKLAPRESGGG